MNAADVVAAQADLLYHLAEHAPNSRLGTTPLHQYFSTLATQSMGEEHRREVEAVVGYVTSSIAAARAYRVQENMTEEIQRRAEAITVGPGTVITGDMLPSHPHGIVHLAEPLALQNYRGVEMLTHWITWTTAVSVHPEARPGQRVVIISMLCDLDLAVDGHTRYGWERNSRLARETSDELMRGVSPQNRPVSIEWNDGERLHREMMGRWSPHTVGYLTEHCPLPDHDPSGVEGNRNAASRMLLALWQMLDETLPSGPVEQSDEHVPRTAARRARNEGIVDPAVTSVTLRRQSRPVIFPGTGTPMDSRLWIAPYEAWRWVGSGANRRRVRRMIAGHWSNGDESLPVRQRRVVAELRR